MAYISLAEKNSLVSKLIELAKADGVVSPSEVTYVFWIAKKLEVSQTELQRLFTDAAPHYAPITIKDRAVVFHKCLNIVVLDGIVSTPEIDKCLKIAKELKLPEDKTLALMEDLKTNPTARAEETILAVYLQQ
ncbi:MAG: putative tellurite resistance protein B-like protein [Glaciecola sp.]|jgi:uncharacterized tellurite resistance protein B-like protein